ncbi:GAF domain-containing protein [Actinomadura gamaensis]|uniref:GAF domain-containing protein n=1 Tax=Actinomadura gamaensis TaxID=1763541 RepID=A0ABV9TTS1_9ACTN
MSDEDPARPLGARMNLPQLRLDDLLNELQARLAAARATRDRVHALLEAVVSIGSDLDLETVLRRLVEAATTLADARYGALGVISEDRERLVQFITVGVGEEEIAAIGHWPEGHGILGLLIKQPRPLRLADLGAHPESYGFPANHPPMRAFLGVPIRVRDEVFGNLYLTEKRDGREFEEEDEVVVSALATAAGVAIENARLYDLARRREGWLGASAEISTALLSGGEIGPVTELVARRVREVADGKLAAVVLADAGGEEFAVVSADGADAGKLTGSRFAPAGVPREVFRDGRATRLEDGRTAFAGIDAFSDVAVGPLLIVPLGTGSAARGVIAVAREPQGPAFDDGTQRLLEAFAGQAAVALELADRRRDDERIALLEDRDRIARDLHDTVIQRLFATAMTLMAAIKMTQKREVAVRVQRAVDDLDATVRQIRSTIFALQSTPGESSLRSRIHALVDGVTEQLGFAPSVRLDGLLDTVVPDDVADHLVAVVREALSNVARHARASRAEMSVDVGDDDLVLRVADDGVGMHPGEHRGGLNNMLRRAEELGGELQIDDGPDGGTVLTWRVPLPPA